MYDTNTNNQIQTNTGKHTHSVDEVDPSLLAVLDQVARAEPRVALGEAVAQSLLAVRLRVRVPAHREESTTARPMSRTQTRIEKNNAN